MQPQGSIYTKIHMALSWKRIIAFNILLLLVLVVPLSVRLAQEDTETRSSAAEELKPSPEPPPNYPVEPPRVDRVSLFYGKPGDTIVLLGDNFGDYQWESNVYIGNLPVADNNIVRWGDNAVDVEIPLEASTGKVSIYVNGRRSIWKGNLLIYSISESSKTGLSALGGSQVVMWTEKGERIVQGEIELGYELGQVTASAPEGISITEQANEADAFGNILKVSFTVNQPLARSKSTLLNLVKSVGALEIIRAEYYDSSGRLIEVYSDPLSVSISL